MTQRLVLDNDNALLVDLDSGSAWMRWSDHAIGDAPERWIDDAEPRRVLLRCGHPASGFDPSRWGQSAWERFDEQVRRAGDEAARRGVELWVRPHAEGMLSDAVGTASWARRMEGTAVRLLIDPWGWVTASMREDAEDHMTRIAGLMAGCPMVGAVMLPPGGDASLVEPLRGLVASAGVVAARSRADFGAFDAPRG